MASASAYAIRPRRRTSRLRLPTIPVFDSLFYHRHELIGDRAVDQTMVVSERQIGHRPDPDRIVDDDGALLDRADTEDRDLRLVDDRHPELRAEHARIRDRERAAGHVVRLELLAARPGRKIGDRAAEAEQVPLVRVLD